MDAFDADVLIFAASASHPLGARVRSLFSGPATDEHVGVGSLLLLPEVMSRPMRESSADEVADLNGLLAHLDLRPLDRMTAQIATALAAKYRLRAPDAVQLATGVNAGATRFLTNNSRDFPKSITEIDITYPLDLPAAT
ncbi:MAG: PIN domain-containing protein [Actinobacteria bacterium]|nr:PIN domain-containing protein [Actinomycetota bacterium]